MSRDAAVITALITHATATGNRRARRWVKALARDKGNPATLRIDGRLGLPSGDALDTLLTRPWMNWPSPQPFGPDRLRRRT